MQVGKDRDRKGWTFGRIGSGTKLFELLERTVIRFF